MQVMYAIVGEEEGHCGLSAARGYTMKTEADGTGTCSLGMVTVALYIKARQITEKNSKTVH